MLEWADRARRLEVWTNADKPEEAAQARRYGAQGIGLCRTEHMFREGERLDIVRDAILVAFQATRAKEKLAAGGSLSAEDSEAVNRLDLAMSKLEKLQELSGGFGTILAFAHDWAPREQMWRSYELIARFVMPHFQGQLESIDRSAAHVTANKEKFMSAATGAIMKAISSDQRAVEALATTQAGPFNIAPAQSTAQPGGGK